MLFSFILTVIEKSNISIRKIRIMPDKKLIFSKDQIKERVRELAEQICNDYAEKELVMIGILNGAFIFMSDLVRTIDMPLEIDFIRVASYGSYSASSGTVTFTKDIELSIKGKNVLLVEDIVDTGNTLSSLKKHILDKKPSSLKICALIDKKERREMAVDVDYVGFEIKKGFLVGYGLDYAEQHRHYPDIYHLLSID